MTLFVGVVVIGVVGYDIYANPPDPKPVGTAEIEVSGTAHFRGRFGIAEETYAVEGVAPATIRVPYGQGQAKQSRGC